MKTMKEDEFFVGNTKTNRDLSYLKGVEYRLGEKAIDIHGRCIDESEYLPLFIKKNSYSLYNSIMLSRLNKK